MNPYPPPKITEDECFRNFQRFLSHEKPGLDVFYSNEDLKMLVPAAKKMILTLFDLGCGKEGALQLSILILYDMVMLIGLKISPTYSSDA